MQLTVAVEQYKCNFERWSPMMGPVFNMYAYDTETTPISEDRPDLTPELVLATACDGTRGVFLTRDTVLAFFEAHAGKEFICHNAAFDLKVTQRVFGDRHDIYSQVEDNKVWDTLVLKRLYSLATEGHTARNEASLAMCAQKHLDVDLKKHLRDSLGHQVRTNFGRYLHQPFARIPRPYLEYAAADTIVTWHLFWRLNEQIREILQNSERGQDPGGFLGGFCASWLRFSKKVPSKSLIA